jgi:hypothetical protein
MTVPDDIVLNDFAHLPVSVGWREERRKGKATKVPYSPRTGWEAKSNDAATWATRGEAETWLSQIAAPASELCSHSSTAAIAIFVGSISIAAAIQTPKPFRIGRRK